MGGGGGSITKEHLKLGLNTKCDSVSPFALPWNYAFSGVLDGRYCAGRPLLAPITLLQQNEDDMRVQPEFKDIVVSRPFSFFVVVVVGLVMRVF